MVSLFGLDLQGPLDAIRGATKDLFAGLDLGGAGRGDQSGVQARDPFGGWQAGQRDPFAGVRFGANSQLDDLNLGGDPFAGLSGMLNSGDNPFMEFSLASTKAAAKHEADKVAEAAGKAATAARGGTGTQGGGGWTGPATAADNATLTADKVEQVIAQTRANSPLKGKGAWLLAEANKRNISLPLFMGIMLAESELGTTAGPGWGALVGLGGAGGLHQYGSIEEAALAGMDNLAGETYRGKSLQDQVGIWFTGKTGLDQTDGVNGSTGQYISGKVAPMFAALGVPFQQAAAPTRQAAPGYSGGAGGMASIWGGGSGPITQGYGAVTPGIDQGIYGYGAAYGLPAGHTGDDIGIPRGTQLYIPAGLSGVVEVAGGTPYFRDEDYGDHGTPGKGELRIRLSNGDILIYGHTSQIGVQVGQQVGAGQAVALSGSASGDHLHLEVRRRNADGSYILVDPVAYFGGH